MSSTENTSPARRKLIAGNWKMNPGGRAAVKLAEELVCRFRNGPPVDVWVFPPAVWLMTVGRALEGSSIEVGAQNVSHESDGAFTGEISATMLSDVGCQSVIVGHSERRTLYGETSELVNAKALAVLRAGLKPVICLGETLDERESGRTGEVVERQFLESLAGISAGQMAKTVIAYEPVWAIGTGRVATGEQAQAVHADLRKMLESQYNPRLAAEARIIYGGSVKPDNADDLLGRPDIDGALVGGASLDADSFAAIVERASALANAG